MADLRRVPLEGRLGLGDEDVAVEGKHSSGSASSMSIRSSAEEWRTAVAEKHKAVQAM